MLGQFRRDPVQPLMQHRPGAGIERREAANDASLALGNDQLRTGNDEQRRSDQRQAQVLEHGRHSHGQFPLKVNSVYIDPKSSVLTTPGKP
jgi:hypothetical protein